MSFTSALPEEFLVVIQVAVISNSEEIITHGTCAVSGIFCRYFADRERSWGQKRGKKPGCMMNKIYQVSFHKLHVSPWVTRHCVVIP